MSRQLFPDIEQLLDIIVAENPEGVYATDRADSPDISKRSYSSSELRAHAQAFADLYLNLQSIYQDKFITIVTPDGLAKWEKELFASSQDSTQPYSVRQQKLLAKFRANGGVSLPAISDVIAGILLPVGLQFDIFPWGGQFNGVTYGSWILDYSSLGLDTFLALIDPLLGTGLGLGQSPLDCSQDYAAAGLTYQQMLDIQEVAYTYEVWIYGAASADTLTVLDQQLTALEPARSTHIIRNNMVRPAI